MKRVPLRIGLVVLLVLGLARIAWAQENVPLTIRNVTSETLPNGEVVLVITGIGFGLAITIALLWDRLTGGVQ